MDALTERIRLLTRCPIWAITPDSFAALATRIFSRLPWESKFESLKPQTKGAGDNKLVVIPIEGVLTQNESWAGTTYGMIAQAVEDAAADPSVKRVVLAVDSPGGEVTGLPETAGLIAQLATVKPVSAIVEGTSASAAYWLTSQAHDINITPSAEVGSVGVRMMHVDVSKALEDAGIKVTELHAGEFKTEWSPFHPLTDAAKEDMQTRLSVIHTDFINAVGAGRGKRASPETWASRFGEGRMFSANDALSKGMVDRVIATRDFYRAILPQQAEAEQVPYGLPRNAARVRLARARTL